MKYLLIILLFFSCTKKAIQTDTTTDRTVRVDTIYQTDKDTIEIEGESTYIRYEIDQLTRDLFELQQAMKAGNQDEIARLETLIARSVSGERSNIRLSVDKGMLQADCNCDPQERIIEYQQRHINRLDSLITTINTTITKEPTFFAKFGNTVAWIALLGIIVLVVLKFVLP